MQETPYKGPIRYLGEHVVKYDTIHNLPTIANLTHKLHKRLENDDIDKILSNNLWTNPTVTMKQKKVPIKIRSGQYMGHAKKITLLPHRNLPIKDTPYM